jgi:hypothetical protein
MTDYFYEHHIRIFDYPKWAEPWRDAIRENLERVAAENGVEIMFIRSKKKFRQEKHVQEVLDARTRARSSLHLVGDGAVRQL